MVIKGTVKTTPQVVKGEVKNPYYSYEKAFYEGQLDIISKSNALKGSASGTDIIAIADVSPIEHNVGVKLTSKNLYAPTLQNFNGNGITAVKNNDNTYTINGTASEEIYIHVGEVLPCEEGKTYYFSGGTANIFVAYQLKNNGSSVKSITVNDQVQSDNATNWNEVNVVIEIPKGTVSDNVIIKPMISLFDNTPYTPYVEDLSAVTVQRLGKNLCNTGTATFTRGITIELSTPLPANTPFVFSGIFETDYTGTGNLIQFYYIDGTTESSNWRMFSVGVTDRQKVTGNFSKAIKSITVYAGPNWSSSAGLTATLTDVQFEIGSAATEFEPYIEPTEHTANADGTVEGIKSLYPNMTLMTDTEGVTISAEYIKDIDKAFGEQVLAIAISGGE